MCGPSYGAGDSYPRPVENAVPYASERVDSQARDARKHDQRACPLTAAPLLLLTRSGHAGAATARDRMATKRRAGARGGPYRSPSAQAIARRTPLEANQ
jgi:hypothetical protein